MAEMTDRMAVLTNDPEVSPAAKKTKPGRERFFLRADHRRRAADAVVAGARCAINGGGGHTGQGSGESLALRDVRGGFGGGGPRDLSTRRRAPAADRKRLCLYRL